MKREKRIHVYQIDLFLRLEYGYIIELPLNMETCIYNSVKGLPEIRLPNKDILLESEIVDKILNKHMYRRLLEYIAKT